MREDHGKEQGIGDGAKRTLQCLGCTAFHNAHTFQVRLGASQKKANMIYTHRVEW